MEKHAASQGSFLDLYLHCAKLIWFIFEEYRILDFLKLNHADNTTFWKKTTFPQLPQYIAWTLVPVSPALTSWLTHSRAFHSKLHSSAIAFAIRLWSSSYLKHPWFDVYFISLCLTNIKHKIGHLGGSKNLNHWMTEQITQ
jgi:hypothetical protein